jgi:hypothetical protein
MEFASPTSLAYLDGFCPDQPALYTQRDFEAALRAEGFAIKRQHSIGFPQPMAYQFRRVLGRSARNLHRGRGSKLLCLMMGPASFRLIPDGILNRCALHCWDTWPDNFDRWDSLFTRFKTETAFFTSRQARDRFQTRFPAMRCHWLPDGSNPELHRPEKTLASRSIDVLELGRRYDRYHAAITTPLLAMGAKHLYELQPGQVVFSGREALLEGLANTKIVVSFPTSVTNAARAAIETITPRYFEAMASGCLVIGHCPRDLSDLFGYNPVIEAEMDDPAGQLKEVVHHVEDYEPLVHRNLSMIKENSWAHRARTVKGILDTENDSA